jgi:type VI secretion system secreted protein Hcp
MAFDIYLKIDDIKGESTDAKHKDEIDVLSFSWGESNAATSISGAGAGKVQMQPFMFTARTNKASPALFLACASGKHIDQAVLSLARAVGGQKQDFMVWKLSDVLISAYRITGNEPEAMRSTRRSARAVSRAQ